jgi:hypothetical protein
MMSLLIEIRPILIVAIAAVLYLFVAHLAKRWL